MLESIRTRKLLIQIVLGFVILVFIAFYAGDFAGRGSRDESRYVATIGPESISKVEFQNMVDYIEQQQGQFFKGQDMTPQIRTYFRKQALRSLEERKLLLLEARKQGITASKDELKRSIMESPYFTEDGHFIGIQDYKLRVDRLFHMDIPSFEKMKQEEIIISKYYALLTSGSLVTDDEVEEQYRKNDLTAKIDYVIFDKPSLEKDVQVSKEEARAYYDAHKSEFQTGELRKVQYLLISHDSEKNRVQVPESELKAQYEKNAQRYTKQEQVHARHILLKSEGKDDAAVKKQAEDLVAQLRAGGDFAALAKQFSEDPGSKENGGDLGFFERGRMAPEFEQAAFSLGVNQISDPVKTMYGYHIIQVLEKQAPYKLDYALVKDQIYRELSLPKAIKNAEEQAKKIADEIEKNKKPMAEISKLQLVELKTTDFFGHDQDLPGLSPGFRTAAFELKKGAISKPTPVFQDFAIIQLLDTKPSQQETFEAVEFKATEKVRQEKLDALSRQKADTFHAALAGATDLKAAADKDKLTIKTSEPFSTEGFVSELGRAKEVSDRAFAMTVGQISEPVKTDQGYIVFQLKEKKQFDQAEFTKQKDQIRRQLLGEKQNSFLQAYLDGLRKKYEKQIWENVTAVAPEEAEQS
jgi:peptidyl-prolyl cis-trans isomerase D